jgi:hypothetical protein
MCGTLKIRYSIVGFLRGTCTLFRLTATQRGARDVGAAPGCGTHAPRWVAVKRFWLRSVAALGTKGEIMALKASFQKTARNGGSARFRRPARRSRRLGVEKLEQRQMLDGGGVVLYAPLAEGESAPMPDFSLTDRNSTSPTYQQSVSPRDYLGQVSGWYLGAAL